MRFIRYQQGNTPPHYGWLFENNVGLLDGTPFGEHRRSEATIPLRKVKLLAPVLPGKIIAVGRNYAEHAREHGEVVPPAPLIFLKPPSSVIGPGETICLPPQSKQVEHEAELAVVMGRSGRWIPPEWAQDYVLGYTCANDVTARDLQRSDGQWTRAKGFDTFCPLGPWIETDFDPADAVVTCRVGGAMRQMASTREMAFSVAQLIAYISTVMTLEPGDVILTGTPAGVGPLEVGDVVEVDIEGLGTLHNPVALEQVG
jgi:2-keto-4-pentenoate hydratase/2-oxohepta-3-ene-1,7-dioic acid hydratase in catechol pathway